MDERPERLSPTPRWVGPALFALGLWAVLATLAAVWTFRRLPEGRSEDPVPASAPEMPPPDPELALLPASFTDLPGWGDDDPRPALATFLASCRPLERMAPDRPMTPPAVDDPDLAAAFGTAGDWQAACAAARRRPPGDPAAARRLVEELFAPWAVADGAIAEAPDPHGLFTGYYEPTLHGSRRRGGRFQHPLYRRPPELVAVDLGAFREGLAGERIAGRVEGGRLLPFADRAEVDAGALVGRGLELVWVDDPVDAFFLHVQGSGRVELAEGGTLRVGYAGQNGHVYTAIGRELIDRGELTREEVSMQSIRRWLEANPNEASGLMAVNRSYVFFRRLEGPGPLGSQGVPLTPGRSLAVDRTFLPLGAPLWLVTDAPSADGAAERPVRRLVVAQDTGGAIRGPVRGDLFWGPGDRAAEIAGRMKHPGRLWALLPRTAETSPTK